MRIVLDAMGSDDCPGPELQAAIEAVRLFGDEIFLVGPQQELANGLQKLGSTDKHIQVIDAAETITMNDKGLALALKANKLF